MYCKVETRILLLNLMHSFRARIHRIISERCSFVKLFGRQCASCYRIQILLVAQRLSAKSPGRGCHHMGQERNESSGVQLELAIENPESSLDDVEAQRFR